jgi:predicted ATPase
LLSDVERMVLRRLAVFVGHFTMDAALAVVTSRSIDQSLVFGAIDSLVAKSMVATRPAGGMMRYRLLETTRAYALEIAVAEAELVELAARHATYYRDRLNQIGAEAPSLSAPAQNGCRYLPASTTCARPSNGALARAARRLSASSLPPQRRPYS